MLLRTPTIDATSSLTKGKQLTPLDIASGIISPTLHYLEHDLVFYVTAGAGMLWIKQGGTEYMSEIAVGSSILLERGSMLQFNNNSTVPLLINHYSIPGNVVPTPAATEEQCASWEMKEYPRVPENLCKRPSGGYDYIAPDGSEGRALVETNEGKMNQFILKPNVISTAVKHAIIEEFWFIQSGSGQMWLKSAEGDEQVIDLTAGTHVTIPVRTKFQFRNISAEDNLVAILLTMPPYPGDHIASFCDEKWEPTLRTPQEMNPLNSMVADKRHCQQFGTSNNFYVRSELNKYEAVQDRQQNKSPELK